MPSAWNNFVKQFYEEKLKTNPDYKFKQALSDAAPVWKSKNRGASGPAVAAGVKKAVRRSRMSRKVSKSKKHSKRRRSHGRKTRRH